ncbi:MAG TPA: type II toxin-antitoxin system VapC family toxin [Bryobacteraceae bacterium]|nr:type II toxin-antitoxin system VapC family toxin [Bryobacteraceae bacterium]
MILDTNSLSAFADDAPAAVAAVGRAEEVFIPAIVLGEYTYGIAHSTRQREYEAWLEQFLAVCVVLDVTRRTTVWYSDIRSELRRIGKPIPANDVWIAALCREHNLPLLSRDGHFDRVKGLKRLTW